MTSTDLREENTVLLKQRDEAWATIKRLNRRAQKAESLLIRVRRRYLKVMYILDWSVRHPGTIFRHWTSSTGGLGDRKIPSPWYCHSDSPHSLLKEKQ